MRHFLRSVIALSACVLPGCIAYSVLSPTPLPDGSVVHQNVAYAPPGADPDRHRLDVYLPKGAGPHPVVIFVHGGYWQVGGRQAIFGVYERLGRRLATRGFAAVVPSYRLSPRYKYPVHIEDVAGAIASTLHNLDKINGDPRQVYLIGHSAGGHLVTTAALEKRWLAVHGFSPNALAGVVSISGIYDVEDLARDRFGIANVLRVFGRNEDRWKRGSPVQHASSSAPPLFLAIGDADEPFLRRQHAAMFEAMKKSGARVEELEIAHRTHSTIVTELFADGDPLGTAIEDFIKRPRGSKRAPSAAP